MMMTGEEVLEVLDRLIVQVGDKRVEQMLHIAGLLACGESAAAAEDDLRGILKLLSEMQEQRLIQHLALHPSCPDQSGSAMGEVERMVPHQSWAEAEAAHDIAVSLLKLGQSIRDAERRVDVQVALIASLAGQERRQAQAWEVLTLIEATLRQAQQNHAVMKSLLEPDWNDVSGQGRKS